MIQLACLGLIGFSTLQAQQTRDPRKSFEKARIIQELEHDPESAAELYRAVARHAQSEELRTSATLRLGICLEQLGQAEAAARAFARAANGKEEAAERARARLKGQGQRQEKLVGRVQFLIGQLRGDAGNASQARKDLICFGDEAVPFLVQEIEAEQFDLSFVAPQISRPGPGRPRPRDRPAPAGSGPPLLCRRALDCPDPAQRYFLVGRLLEARRRARIPAASERRALWIYSRPARIPIGTGGSRPAWRTNPFPSAARPSRS
ncbi:MAG: hypothetical protein ACE5F1_08845 [Planctomycetota bacterium]